MVPDRVPDVTFRTRVRDGAGPEAAFIWKDASSAEIFGGRNVVLFALPGAFTPACSETHLPGYEAACDDIRGAGVDEIYCLSVNDAFVMFQWARMLNATRVRMLPDGNGDFSRLMGMLVNRSRQGMGLRSWRYSLHAVDGEIRRVFAEPGFGDDPSGVPVTISDAATMLDYLRGA